MTTLVKDWDSTLDQPPARRDLFTYCAIALLTRRRASDDDQIPDPVDRGGWWGDAYPDVPGDLQGSRLWTLQGRPITEALELAPAMVLEALACGVEDGLFLEVIPSVAIAGPGVLSVGVQPVFADGKSGDVLGPWYISV